MIEPDLDELIAAAEGELRVIARLEATVLTEIGRNELAESKIGLERAMAIARLARASAEIAPPTQH